MNPILGFLEKWEYEIYILYKLKEIEIYRLIKELAHMIVEAGKFEICRVSLQARDSGKN